MNGVVKFNVLQAPLEILPTWLRCRLTFPSLKGSTVIKPVFMRRYKTIRNASTTSTWLSDSLPLWGARQFYNSGPDAESMEGIINRNTNNTDEFPGFASCRLQKGIICIILHLISQYPQQPDHKMYVGIICEKNNLFRN